MEVKIATVLSARAARFLSQKLSGQSAKIATSFKLTTNARKRCACKILSIRMVQICSTGYIYKGNYSHFIDFFN